MKYNIGDKVRVKKSGYVGVVNNAMAGSCFPEPNYGVKFIKGNNGKVLYFYESVLEKVEECTKELKHQADEVQKSKTALQIAQENAHNLKHNPCCDTVECSRCGKKWGQKLRYIDIPDDFYKPLTFIGDDLTNGTTWTSKDIGESGWSYHNCS